TQAIRSELLKSRFVLLLPRSVRSRILKIAICLSNPLFRGPLRSKIQRVAGCAALGTAYLTRL
ncbi:hypothetical protein, partial [Rhodopseudomonas palustris]|uniref:hypothetical protein n=1 Tax=Rhodopseudomonas palustris TaxID=1076 RepID=UPI00195D9FC7